MFLSTHLNHLKASLTKWLSVRLRTKWLWVRVPLQSLKRDEVCQTHCNTIWYQSRPWEDKCHPPKYGSTTRKTKPTSIYMYDQISLIILPKLEYRHWTSNTTHQKSIIFNWSTAHHTAFEKVKSFRACTPVQQYFDSKKQVVLQVDASEKGLGVTLLQKNDNSQLQPIDL